MPTDSSPPASGRCPPRSVESVLAWCASSRFDGVLAFERGDVRRVVPFRAGRIDTRVLPAPDAMEVLRWMIEGGPGAYELLGPLASERPGDVVYFVDHASPHQSTSPSGDRTERLAAVVMPTPPSNARVALYGLLALLAGLGVAAAIELITRG